MLDTFPHAREALRIVRIRRSAGAEGRLFPTVCTDAELRRTFERQCKQEGKLEIQLVKAGLEQPIPEALASHRGDHYNRILFCVDFVDAAVRERGPRWFEALERSREDFLKPGTWVLLWLPRPELRRLLRQHAPQTWNDLALAPVLYTESLLTNGSGTSGALDPVPTNVVELADRAATLGDPFAAVALLAEALRAAPDDATAGVRMGEQLLELGYVAAAAAVFAHAEGHSADAAGMVRAARGRYEAARRVGDAAALRGHWDRARAHVLQAKTPSERARVLGRLAEIEQQGAATPGIAAATLSASVDAARESGDLELLVDRLLARATAQRAQRDPLGALETLAEAREAGAHTRLVLSALGRAHVAAAVGAARRGDDAEAGGAFDSAQVVLAQAYNLARDHADLAGQADVAMDLADLNFRAANIDAATASLDLAHRLAEEAGLGPVAFTVLKARRVAHFALGNTSGALGDLELMADLARAMGYPALDAEAIEAKGDHQANLRIPRVAQTYWAEAQQLFEALGLSDDAGRCREKISNATG